MYLAGHDVNATVGGRPLRLEVKSRATGLEAIYSWLGDNDALIIKADRSDPLVVCRQALAAQLVSTGPI